MSTTTTTEVIRSSVVNASSEEINQKNRQLVEGLRGLLAFVEANQDFDFVPGSSPMIVVEGQFQTWYLSSDEGKRRLAIADLTRRMVKVGKVEKVYSGDWAWIRLGFGPMVRFEIATMRQTICERVVVGKKVIPAQPERVIPAQAEQTVDETEWRCHPVMTVGVSHEAVDGQMGELESGTDGATLQLKAGALVAAGKEEDDDFMPF